MPILTDKKRTQYTLLLLHPFNGLLFRTTWVSWYQKGKTSLDLNEARGGFWEQWHQLDHMQTICTLLQTDDHTNSSSLNFYRPDALLTPTQKWQSSEGLNAVYSRHTHCNKCLLYNTEHTQYCELITNDND